MKMVETSGRSRVQEDVVFCKMNLQNGIYGRFGDGRECQSKRLSKIELNWMKMDETSERTRVQEDVVFCEMNLQKGIYGRY